MRNRDPRQRQPSYMGFIAKLPCVAHMARHGAYKRPVQVAHIRAAYPEEGWRPVGKSEKPHDWRTAPLCVSCHLDGPGAQHKSNETEWWAELGIYPPALCAALQAAFKTKQSGAAVIATFAAQAMRERVA